MNVFGYRAMTGAFAALMLVSLLALAVACNGGGAGDSSPTAAGTPGDNGSPPAAGTPTKDVQELLTLAEQAAEGVKAKVTYRYRTDAEGALTNGEWLLVRRPPKSRIEFVIPTENDGETRTIVLDTGEKSYLCFSSSSNEGCVAIEPGGAADVTAALDPLLQVPARVVQQAAEVNLVERSHRTIAKVEATCFTLKSAITDLGDGEMCFSEDGLLLFLNGKSGDDEFTLEATSIDRAVNNEDFEPPFEIKDLADMDGVQIGVTPSP